MQIKAVTLSSLIHPTEKVQVAVAHTHGLPPTKQAYLLCQPNYDSAEKGQLHYNLYPDVKNTVTLKTWFKQTKVKEANRAKSRLCITYIYTNNQDYINRTDCVNGGKPIAKEEQVEERS